MGPWLFHLSINVRFESSALRGAMVLDDAALAAARWTHEFRPSSEVHPHAIVCIRLSDLSSSHVDTVCFGSDFG